MTATATGERLLRDVRVAEVYAPGVAEAPYRKARAFVTSHRIVVWAAPAERHGAPVKVMDEAITGERPAADRGTQGGQITVETAKGTVYVTRGGGCGCGSTLSALSPPVPW